MVKHSKAGIAFKTEKSADFSGCSIVINMKAETPFSRFVRLTNRATSILRLKHPIIIGERNTKVRFERIASLFSRIPFTPFSSICSVVIRAFGMASHRNDNGAWLTARSVPIFPFFIARKVGKRFYLVTKGAAFFHQTLIRSSVYQRNPLETLQ